MVSELVILSRLLDYTSTLRLTFCGVGGALLVCSLVVLACTPQDDGRHSFGHAGGMLKIYQAMSNLIYFRGHNSLLVCK